MLRFLLLFFLFSISVFDVYAQEVEAYVRNAGTGEGVPYASVYFPEYHHGTSTDETGRFFLQAQNGRELLIQVSSVGFETRVLSLVVQTGASISIEIQPGHIDLDEVIVSVPLGRLQSENITSIESRKLSALNPSAAANMAEIISAIPGVSFQSTGNGIGKPVIRGLSGSRVVTYAQGLRMENQQWGDDHGLGVGSLGIEAVELIKGPASLLYGSDALGGVLYFVDERYADAGQVEGNISFDFLGNNMGLRQSAGLKVNTRKIKYNVFAGYNNQADYQLPGGNRVFNTRYDNQNLVAALGYGHKNWISNWRYAYSKDKIGLLEADSLYSDNLDRNIKAPSQTVEDHRLSWEQILYIGEAKLQGILGYLSNRRQEFEEMHEGPEEEIHGPALDMHLQTWTYNLKYEFPQMMEGMQWQLGSQGMMQFNANDGEEQLIPDAQTRDFGLFSRVSYGQGPWQWQAGVRWDERAISAGQNALPGEDALQRKFQSINGALGASWNRGAYTLKGNVSTGFRAPNTSELLSDGAHHGSNQYVKGNAKLKSEQATQLDLTLDFQKEHVTFTFQPFYNVIQNYIYLQPQDSSIGGLPLYAYTQQGAMIYGGETGFHFHPHHVHWLHWESNFSLVLAENKQGEALPLIPPAQIQTMLKGELRGSGKFRVKYVFLGHRFKFSQNRTDAFESNSPSYQLFDVGAHMEYRVNDHFISVDIGVKNIFNSAYTDHLSRLKTYGINNPGINPHISLKWEVHKRLKDR